MSDVQRALRALRHENPPLFGSMPELDDGRVTFAVNPTGDARRRVGLWPTPDALADRLVEALQQAADREPDAEKRGWLSKTAGYLASGGRQIAIEVTAAVLKRQLDLE